MESLGGESRQGVTGAALKEMLSPLADAYEALMGALYLDSDYVTVRRIVLTETRERLENLA